jgi:hypothetical protein
MGRPKGVKDTKPRKPRSDRKVKPEQTATPEAVEAVEPPKIIETKPATPEMETVAKQDERITEDFKFIIDSYEDAASESETIEEDETGIHARTERTRPRTKPRPTKD